jgi:hypothetical protein
MLWDPRAFVAVAGRAGSLTGIATGRGHAKPPYADKGYPPPSYRPPRWGRLVLTSCSLAGLCWYLFGAIHVDIVELARALGGLAALWLPFGALIWVLVGRAFADRLSRFTFSAIACYALTTLVYFGVCLCRLWLPGLGWLFSALRVGALLVAVLWGWRRSRAAARPAGRTGWAPDWVLVCLLVTSMLVTARYKSAFELRPSSPGDGQYLLVTDPDQTYYAALAWELLRRVPAQQQPTRAGVPDRAYHMFPHLTTALVARFAGQADVLRAHLVYEYTILEVLLGLALYCITRRLTGSRLAGYAGLALLFIGAVPLPPISGGKFASFYFTLWPHASSTVEPTLMTSPQMYSGVVVLYGILLGVTAVAPQCAGQRPMAGLVLVLAALVGAMLRFRVQIFLPLVAGFLVLLLCQACKTRRAIFLAAGGVTLGIAAALLLEMRLPTYLPGTAEVVLGNSHLAVQPSFLSCWPGAVALQPWLRDTMGRANPQLYLWLWPILCLSLFALLNVVGIPMVLACACYLRQPRAWREQASYTGLVLWLAVGSILGTLGVRASYDSWSVGGQMPLHVGWYVFPWMGAGLWALGRHFATGFRQPSSCGVAAAVLLIVSAFVWQLVRPASRLEQERRDLHCAASQEEWQALCCIRSTLPSDAVVLTAELHGPLAVAVTSGVGGRRVYLEYPTPIKTWMASEDSNQSRLERIRRVWAAQSEGDFRRALPPQVTHLLEFTRLPLRVHPDDSLRLVWTSPRRQVRIWQIVRPTR